MRPRYLLRVFHVFTICLWIAGYGNSASAQNAPAPNLSELEAAYNREVQEKVDPIREAGLAKLSASYQAALDALLKKTSSTGSLDSALLVQNEIAEFSKTKTVPATDAAGIHPEIAQLRKAWRAEYERLENQRRAATTPHLQAFLERLRQLEIELTKSLKLDEAKVVRTRREALAAQLPVAPVAPAPTVAQALGPLGTATGRPVERADLYASGCNNCTIFVNGKEIIKVMRDKAGKQRVSLREGYVIAVQIADRVSDNIFWLSAISPNDEFLFDTSERWVNFVPADPKKWWLPTGSKQKKPAVPAAEGFEYLHLVKRAAAATPHYKGAQPIHAPLEGGPRLAYLYFVVTKQDLVPKTSAVPGTK